MGNYRKVWDVIRLALCVVAVGVLVSFTDNSADKIPTKSLNMQFDTLSIDSKFDGLSISVLEIVPEGKPLAVVYLVHGLCGCKERFIPFMEYLASKGFACVASDHRGHGSSILKEEDRGYMYNGGTKAIVMDMDVVVDYISERFDNPRLFMLGHSMGSLAARAYVKYHDSRLDGLVICGSPSPNPMAPVGYPFIKLLSKVSGGRMHVGGLQKQISRNYNKRFKKEGQQAWTCSDPQVRQAFAEDSRCNFDITADCAATLMDLFREAYSEKGWSLDNPQMPIVFFSGDDDPCMLSEKKFLKSVDCMRINGYKDVKSQTYPGMRHEILNEVNKQDVWEDIVSFLRTFVEQ